MSGKKDVVSFLSINERVATEITEKASAGAVDKIVAKRVEAEQNRRAELLEKALDKYNTAKKDLAKCKPDDIKYEIVGEVPVKRESWTEKALQAKQKLVKTISDLDVAFNKAFYEGDYKKLQELVGGGSGKPKENESESSE